MFDTIASDLIAAANRIEDAAPFTPKGVSEAQSRALAMTLRRHAQSIASLGSFAVRHVSYHENRLDQDNPRERVFAKLWQKVNQDPDGKRYATPYLLALLTRDVPPDERIARGSDRQWIETPMTTRDMRVAASVVQWLGSNIGLSFLEEALNACGFTLVQENRDAVR